MRTKRKDAINYLKQQGWSYWYPDGFGDYFRDPRNDTVGYAWLAAFETQKQREIPKQLKLL
jgi:hypothetical protein